MSKKEIEKELDHLEKIHNKEIGCRVGKYKELLQEILQLRKQNKYLLNQVDILEAKIPFEYI